MSHTDNNDTRENCMRSGSGERMNGCSVSALQMMATSTFSGVLNGIKRVANRSCLPSALNFVSCAFSLS